MFPTQNFPSMGGKRLRHYPHKISSPWEEYNVILCNHIYNHHSRDRCSQAFPVFLPLPCTCIVLNANRRTKNGGGLGTRLDRDTFDPNIILSGSDSQSIYLKVKTNLVQCLTQTATAFYTT